MKNKKSTLLLVSVSLLQCFQLYSGSGGDVNTTTQTCGVGNLMNMSGDISCNFTGVQKNTSLNAVGDLVAWPAAEYTTVLALGQITMPVSKRVSLPAHGKMVRLSMIPTKGTLVNEKIEILFISFDLLKPLPLDSPANIANELQSVKKLLPWAKSVIKMYRRIAPEKQWTEIAMTESSASDPSTLDAADIVFNPDATAIVTTTQYKDAYTGEITTSKIVVPLGSLY